MSPVAERVGADEALSRVRSALGGRAEAGLNHDHVSITCRPEALIGVVTALRDAPDCGFTFFTFLSAIDRSELAEAAGGLEVLVHLYAPERALHVDIHVPVDSESPVCPSLTGIFGGAHWQERETYEMFGIVFEDHPRLVNLYLPEDFEGHPLRRSFRLPSRSVKEWPGAKDPEEAAAGGR